MGYQPSLDGIRAIAVVAVLLYHADVRWLPGGFLGVDVFFVVSGYLITSLLVEERRGSMTTDLKRFWLRRAKRLLPALFAMLAVTCAYAAVAVPDALYRLRTDVLAAATYSTNWWLIASKQSYFEALGRPPLLRHLWSLAVEEQWYLLWPLVFVLAMGLVRGRTERLVVPIVLAALASTVWMAIVFDPSGDASRAYFGTDTRASGLLIGAAAAMVWTPWRWPWAARRRLAGLDAIGWLALLSLVAVMLQWGQTTSVLYRGGFLLVSVLSIVVVAVSVHPGATTFRAALSLAPLRWLGSRSYGLYLWHWPVFMVTRQQDYPDMDGRTRFALRLGLTFALTELSFRLVERPVRDGSAMQWITDWRADRARRSRARGWAAVGATAAVAVGRLRRRPRRDRRTGRRHDRRFGGGLPTRDRGALPAGAGRRRRARCRRRSRPERARARPSPAPCRPTCPGGSSSWATRRPAPWSRTRPPVWVARWRSRTARSRAVGCSTTAPSGRPRTSAVRSGTARAGRTSGRPRRGAARPTSPSSSSGPGTCSTSPRTRACSPSAHRPTTPTSWRSCSAGSRASSRRAARSRCSRCPATTPSTAEG